jgi:hypothetical protein
VIMRVELPDGWAELRDPRKVTVGQRRPAEDAQIDLIDAARPDQIEAIKRGDEEALFRIGAPGSLIRAMRKLNELLVIALVESWSFEAPVSLDGLMDLPGPSYEELMTQAAPLARELMPDMTPEAAETADGEKISSAPFGPSNGSSPGVVAAAP